MSHGTYRVLGSRASSALIAWLGSYSGEVKPGMVVVVGDMLKLAGIGLVAWVAWWWVTAPLWVGFLDLLVWIWV